MRLDLGDSSGRDPPRLGHAHRVVEVPQDALFTRASHASPSDHRAGELVGHRIPAATSVDLGVVMQKAPVGVFAERGVARSAEDQPVPSLVDST